jgi:hypothetical protein
VSGACVATYPPLDRSAFPPPSPPPMLLGIVRGFLGTMRPSDSSSACVPIVRLLPSWAGPACDRTRMRSPRFRTKDVSTCMGSSTARGSSSASHLRGEDVAFSSGERDRHLGIRPVSLLNTQPVVSPCERFRLSLAASPCITRGRGGWLGLTPWSRDRSTASATLGKGLAVSPLPLSVPV